MIFGTVTPARPEFGARIVVSRFAYLPTPLSDGRWVWLENYGVEMEYVRDIGNGDMFESGDNGWVVVRRECWPTDGPTDAAAIGKAK